MQVDVQYLRSADGWKSYKATLVNIERVDGVWYAIVFDIESDAVRVVEAARVIQWEGGDV